jgi:hypothetical protein
MGAVGWCGSSVRCGEWVEFESEGARSDGAVETEVRVAVLVRTVPPHTRTTPIRHTLDPH